MNFYIFNFDMRKFIYKIFFYAVIVLSLLTTTNFLGDSAQLFSSGYENKIANILIEGNNVTNITNHDERILQREWIDKLDSSPDIIILGSSRSMMIREKDFENKKLINNAVSGASIEDLIAIYQIYKSKNIPPKKIILGLDPWIFNENNGEKRWLSLQKEYDSFYNRESDNKESDYYKLKQLVSISYFQSSLKRGLSKIFKENVDPIITNKIYNQEQTKLSDGSITYDKKYTESSNYETVNRRAIEYNTGPMYNLEKFKYISPKLFKEFEKLCLEILNNNIELSIWIPPYHPKVYKKLKQEYQILLKLENKILNFASSKKIEVSGSINPHKSGFISENFYYGMHLKEDILKCGQFFKTLAIFPSCD
jgi:hypothetical protein